jgi:RNA polymerase sigma factor (sigma-70 family)
MERKVKLKACLREYMNCPDTDSSSSQPQRFKTTSWSAVAQVGDSNSENAKMALEYLCQLYWYPLYSFVRRKGISRTDAEDLTQSFFEFLLEQQGFNAADRQRGRFRTFLLAALTNFLNNHWRERAAKKRAIDRKTVSLQIDFAEGEQKYQFEPSHELSAEKVFERSWAITILQETFGELRQSYVGSSKARLFELLSPYLSGEDPPSYREMAAELAITEGALKVAMHRMRGRTKTILRRRVGETVESEDQIDDEIRELFQMFAG